MSLLKIIPIVVVVLSVLIYFGLPRALQALGLHGHYEIPTYRIEGKRALIITTSQSTCLLYTSPSPRDRQKSRMPSSA